ncbi:MAG: 2-amino-4-hydroxy-6-hydroxymethyldihydropteridine diphosphokinase [Candidatus Latescibacteria bacterium]|nr:2-amino-4-hydroxy-6-hydroxymethyldihydropteridine diphosphokinase [Candidatus Latescibacterota bacterium]
MPEIAYIGLGSNLGDRQAHLAAALEALSDAPQTTLQTCSPVYETAPIGPSGQAPYLNAAVALETELDPHALLQVLLTIERSRQRQRTVHWGPRTLDLDLLLYGTRQIETPSLQVPHPLLAERCFVLVPLCQLAPDLRHPVDQRRLSAYLSRLDCANQVHFIGPL